MSIYIRFYHSAGDVNNPETIVDGIDPNSTTCEQLIRKFCEKSSTPFTIATNTDKIAFLYNGRVLNTPNFLNRTLSSINLTKTDKKIIIKDMGNLVNQGH